MEILVRDPTSSDRSAWTRLWSGYLEFYETELAEPVTAALWGRILDPEDPVNGLVSETDGEVMGFVHYFAHPDTWDLRPRCYLQDLFVDPAVRGGGVGRGLIEAVVGHARREGWSGVYWHTAEDNHAARHLYDQVTGGPSGFIVYEKDLGPALDRPPDAD
ncbi:MAG TPA: GNAT family N-acetyltransferase [Acidimicrobiia bacterium]|nr:GNAT family N-acetyltransferase [Acidimicrobiia bacterium]